MARPDPSGHWSGSSNGPPRRNFLVEAAAVVIGGLISLYPMAVGGLMFLDPIFRKRREDAKAGGEKGSEGHGDSVLANKPFLRVGTIDALPADGTPVQTPVLADLTDAWNKEANQPIGAVYLMREGADVKCFNAICPHAGCFVGFAAERKIFQCPCHTSSFQLDGKRTDAKTSPSPRDMDPLEVDPEKLKQGEVWVRFVNFVPGHEAREVK